MTLSTALAGVCFLGCLGAAVALVLLRKRLARGRDREQSLRKQLQTLGDQLREESDIRSELAAALTSMSDAVIAVDTQSRLLRLNRAAGRLLAADPDSVRGRPLVEIVREDGLRRLFEETLSGTPVAHRDLRVAVTDQPVDRPRLVSGRTAVLHGARGERIGAVAVLRDITELRRLEGVRREFVANVSHELKTPVAAIKAAVETLLDDRPADGEAEMEPAERGRFLRMAVRHADRLNDIIDDLLTLSRLEGPDSGPELTTDWLGPVLASAVDTCRPAAEEAGVHVELRVDSGLLARMQPNLLEQAVVNLVENAIKYGGSGGRVCVEGFDRGDRTVGIRVKDSGPGIPAEHLARVFERFYRVDASRSRTGGRTSGGTGLGLSIVRHVAEACGGSVAASSSPGEGACFEMTLPGLPPEDTDSPQKIGEADPREPATAQHSPDLAARPMWPQAGADAGQASRA